MKKFLVLLSVICNNLIGWAQAPTLQWANVFGSSSGNNNAYSVQQVKDGGYIVSGQTSLGYGNNDFFVIKLDAAGNLTWQKNFGGTSSESAYSIQQTSDGGYVVVGGSRSVNNDVTGNHGSFDYWIIKLDANGDLLWQKSLGGSQSDIALSVQQTVDGGYIAAGQSASNDGQVSGNHGNADDWIVKLDGNGTIQWQKSFGGSNLDVANCIRQTKDGGYIVAGGTASSNGDVTGVHDTVYGDFWVLKLDGQGNLKWQKTLGGTDYDQANSVRQTADGGYIVAGFSRSANGNVTGAHGDYDAWLVKLDSDGNLVWQKTYGGSSGDFAYSVEQQPDGGYIFAGGTASSNGQVSGYHGGEDFWVVKTDATGNLQWQLPLGGSYYEEARGIGLTTDGGCVVAGYTNSSDGNVTGHPNGNYVCWVLKLGPSSGGTTCNCVAPSSGFAATNVSSSGASLAWGTISCAYGYKLQYKTAAASTWTTVLINTNTGSQNISGLRSSTSYQWRVATACTASPVTYSSFSTVHTFRTLSRFTTANRAAPSNPDEIAAKDFDLNIYPNPASGALSLHLKAGEETSLQVVNTMGQVVIQKNIATGNGKTTETLDISRLASGMYNIYMRTTNSYISKRFIKQ